MQRTNNETIRSIQVSDNELISGVLISVSLGLINITQSGSIASRCVEKISFSS